MKIAILLQTSSIFYHWASNKQQKKYCDDSILNRYTKRAEKDVLIHNFLTWHKQTIECDCVVECETNKGYIRLGAKNSS